MGNLTMKPAQKPQNPGRSRPQTGKSWASNDLAGLRFKHPEAAGAVVSRLQRFRRPALPRKKSARDLSLRNYAGSRNSHFRRNLIPLDAYSSYFARQLLCAELRKQIPLSVSRRLKAAYEFSGLVQPLDCCFSANAKDRGSLAGMVPLYIAQHQHLPVTCGELYGLHDCALEGQVAVTRMCFYIFNVFIRRHRPLRCSAHFAGIVFQVGTSFHGNYRIFGGSQSY